MNFIKKIFTSLLVKLFSFLIFFIIFIVIAASFSKNMSVKVENNSVLEINLTASLLDYNPSEKDPLSQVLNLKDETVGFNDVCKAIEAATYDDRITGISLRNIPTNMGWAQVTALQKMLKSFKENEKFIYAFDDVYTQKKYYLNSIADSLFISPLGNVDLKGLHSEVMFYKSFQEKYGVKMEVIRHGKYKSAVEPFIADEMSEDNKHQIKELIGGIWSEVQKSISTYRNIDVTRAVNRLEGKSAYSALQNRLVDAVIYEDEYQSKLANQTATEKVNKIALQDYINENTFTSLDTEESKIAVVYAQGSIIYGKGDVNTIGHQKIVKTLNKVAENDDVKAIVLRVNSPGGSALASDLIWRAIIKAKEKKPVIVSMGNYAASGGYYIAAAADRIFAEPTTITGSIGVFGMLPNVSTLTKDLGINTELVSTHNNGAYYSPFQPLDERFKDVVKTGIEDVYDVFLDRVASGRKISIKEVDKVAQGRVWTGTKALEIGLVDEIGGLGKAILYAANKVKLERYSIEELPNYEVDFRDMLSPTSFIKSKISAETVLKDTPFEKLKSLETVFKSTGVQARVPFVMEVH